MNRNDLQISLLSFGDTGMEFVTGQTTDHLDEDHITLIGNFYANVLGAAEDASGLFGPLPVAYRYDQLMFVFGFNSFDSTVKDQRVIDLNHQTRSSLLIFFQAKLDSTLAEHRSQIRLLLNQWSNKYAKVEIRSTKHLDLERLVDEIISLIVIESSKRKFRLSETENIIRVLSKNFFLLETLGRGLEKLISLKLISNNGILSSVLKRALINENIDLITFFQRKHGINLFKFPHLQIEELSIPSSNLENNSMTGKNAGILLFLELTSDRKDLIDYEKTMEKLLKNTNKDTVLSFCLENVNNINIKLNETKIPLILAKYPDRTISLVVIEDSNKSLEIAIIDFIEKVISKLTTYD